MFGFRPDGKRVKNMDPIVRITPYLMPERDESQVFLDHEVDYEPLMRYIVAKSQEGIKITFMEVLIAAYVRAISQLPEVNRFIKNKQVYDRNEISVCFTILLDGDTENPNETAVKVKFDPKDTIFDVSKRVKKVIESNRKQDENSNASVGVASALLAIPLLPNIIVALFRLFDRYGILPKKLVELLPFHTGLFIANMGSIGMTRVYHHLYNFGTASQFFSVGNVRRGYGVDIKGKVVRHCKLPFGITADERICSGAMYAKFFAMIRHGLNNPQDLEKPPESVRYIREDIKFYIPKHEQ